MRLSFLVSSILLTVVPVAVAGGTVPGALPEPGTFELLALAGVVAAVIAIRGRR